MPVRALRSLLASTDLDHGSDPIVVAAARLAARTGAELHLLHVLELGDPRYGTGGASHPRFPDRWREAERSLQEQAERCVPSGVVVASRRVVIYAPHRAIADRVAEVRADLVVLGPHRGGELGARILGSTADRVIRSSPVPCLVVRGALRLPMRCIGVPTDFSDPSRGALELALTVAAAAVGGDSAAPVVRVMHAGWVVDRADNPALEEETIRSELERQTRVALRVLDGSPPPEVVTEVRWGNDPIETTLQWAAEREADLLVLGTHGRGALQRALIGSMAASVARQAPCPVLLVPPVLWSGLETEAQSSGEGGLEKSAGRLPADPPRA